MNTFEKIRNLDLGSLTDDELDDFIKNLLEEQAIRKEEQDWKSWDKVVSAIANYLEKSEDGQILINYNNGQEEFYITADADCGQYPGVIMLYDI